MTDSVSLDISIAVLKQANRNAGAAAALQSVKQAREAAEQIAAKAAADPNSGRTLDLSA